ncbi:MAG TPA: YitT family protein [Clostridia bacterium]|nr:YitT family protein [Clostridia bacterium]
MKLTKRQLVFGARGFVLDAAASTFWAIGIKMFAVPNKIAPSGFTGITVLINYLTGLPIGSMSLLMNIPFLIICWRVIGKDFVLQTVRVLIIFTLLMDLVFTAPPVYTGDPLLAALFGGVFSGIGGGIVFTQGSSGGGTDLIIKLIRKKYPYVSTGQLVVGINGMIMILASVVYGNIEAGLYGLIMSFTSGKVVDTILNGADSAKSVMIVTHQPQRMSDSIIHKLNRSATILSGTGAYNRDDTYVLLCVVRKTEFFQLKRLIRETDPRAFVIVNEANQILGQGFRAIDSADS